MSEWGIDEKDVDKYLYCMKEIKLRMDVISTNISKQWTTGFVIPDNETVCLQFRKVLELIALASLAANKEEYAKQHEKFASNWNARLIFRDLERINPNFYPLPSRQIIDPETKRPAEVEPVESGYLTKEEFVRVYERCGGVLHANNPYGSQRDVAGVSQEFKGWFDRIVTLLDHHQVRLLDADRELWVMMNADDTGEVGWAIMEKVSIEEA